MRGTVYSLEDLQRAPHAHLAPQKLSNAYEETPQPLLQGEACTAEGLTPKLHDDNLKQSKGQPAMMEASPESAFHPPGLTGWSMPQRPLQGQSGASPDSLVELQK